MHAQSDKRKTVDSWEMRIATSPDEVDVAIELVVRKFVDAAILRNKEAKAPLRWRVRMNDPSATVYCMWTPAHQLLGTAAIFLDSGDNRLPMHPHFSKYLDPLLDQGRKLAEVDKLATDEKLVREVGISPSVAGLELVVQSLRHGLNSDIDDFCIVCSPKHLPFYTPLGFVSFTPEPILFPETPDYPAKLKFGARLDLRSIRETGVRPSHFIWGKV